MPHAQSQSAPPARPRPLPLLLPRRSRCTKSRVPTPGTFYSAASPDAAPFVKVGSKVNADTVVCLIEAMKLFTEIQAEVSGVIAEILVQNQQAVEYNTVLFRVDTSG